MVPVCGRVIGTLCSGRREDVWIVAFCMEQSREGERRKLLIKCQRVAVMVEIALRIRKSYLKSSHGAFFASSLKKAEAGVLFHSIQLMRL